MAAGLCGVKSYVRLAVESQGMAWLGRAVIPLGTLATDPTLRDSPTGSAGSDARQSKHFYP